MMKPIPIYSDLPSFLLVALPLATLLQSMWTAVADVTTSISASFTTSNCNETLETPTVFPCPEEELLKMSYVSKGSVDCGGALTVKQAAISPSIRADPSIVKPDALYSLVLVDTTVPTISPNTFFTFDSIHPVLHYGAVNIQGSVLLEGLSLDRLDQLDLFSPYEGPSPPEPNSMWAKEGVEFTLFAYEYMLAAQTVPIEVPQLDSNRNFDYEAFFTETVGVGFSNLTSSTYFVSGWCVTELPFMPGRQDPLEVKNQTTVPPTNTALDPIENAAEISREKTVAPRDSTPTDAPTSVPSTMPTRTTTLADTTGESSEQTDEINESTTDLNTAEEKVPSEQSPEASMEQKEEDEDENEENDEASGSETSDGAKVTSIWTKEVVLIGSVVVSSCLLFYC